MGHLLQPETRADKLGFTGNASEHIATTKKQLSSAIDDAVGGLVTKTNEAPELIWRLVFANPSAHRAH